MVLVLALAAAVQGVPSNEHATTTLLSARPKLIGRHGVWILADEVEEQQEEDFFDPQRAKVKSGQRLSSSDESAYERLQDAINRARQYPTQMDPDAEPGSYLSSGGGSEGSHGSDNSDGGSDFSSGSPPASPASSDAPSSPGGEGSPDDDSSDYAHYGNVPPSSAPHGSWHSSPSPAPPPTMVLRPPPPPPARKPKPVQSCVFDNSCSICTPEHACDFQARFSGNHSYCFGNVAACLSGLNFFRRGRSLICDCKTPQASCHVI